jgi:ketosteroid isomerase-like protein
MRGLLVLAIALLCSLSMSLSVAQETSVENQIKKLEQDWAQALLKGDAASLDRYEAEDIINTDPSGRVTDRTQDKKDLSSGDLKFQSVELSDLKVRVYGNAAVATGVSTGKASFKGQETNGSYRFTDTWIKRNGTWQAVASQGTKVQQ